MEGDFPADVTDVSDGSMLGRTFAIAFVAAGTAQMEERDAAEADQVTCLVGTTMSIEGTLSVSSADYNPRTTAGTSSTPITSTPGATGQRALPG